MDIRFQRTHVYGMEFNYFNTLMHVGFLLFSKKPVTEPTTVYTALLNSVKVAGQLRKSSVMKVFFVLLQRSSLNTLINFASWSLYLVVSI